MISDSAVKTAVPSMGPDGLAEGLMLVRASNLKMIRLQLAMERRDRRAAIEAVDDLVALDRSLEAYLAGGPAGSDQALIGRTLDADRAALHREKLTLAAGVVLERPPWLEPVDALDSDEAAEEEAWLEEPVEPDPPRRARWWLLGTALVASAATGAAFVFELQAAADWLPAMLGG
jgi:hypothetical protein